MRMSSRVYQQAAQKEPDEAD